VWQQKKHKISKKSQTPNQRACTGTQLPATATSGGCVLRPPFLKLNQTRHPFNAVITYTAKIDYPNAIRLERELTACAADVRSKTFSMPAECPALPLASPGIRRPFLRPLDGRQACKADDRIVFILAAALLDDRPKAGVPAGARRCTA